MVPRLKSQGLYALKYGRLEWRAKSPAGIGFWPALWLLGTNITSINWPGCGEIDVFETTAAVRSPSKAACTLALIQLRFIISLMVAA